MRTTNENGKARMLFGNLQPFRANISRIIFVVCLFGSILRWLWSISQCICKKIAVENEKLFATSNELYHIKWNAFFFYAHGIFFIDSLRIFLPRLMKNSEITLAKTQINFILLCIFFVSLLRCHPKEMTKNGLEFGIYWCFFGGIFFYATRFLRGFLSFSCFTARLFYAFSFSYNYFDVLSYFDYD